MITTAPTGTFCNECKAAYGQYSSATKTWSWTKKDVNPMAVIVTTSMTKRSKGASRAYCQYHKVQAETWPDGNGGSIKWSLEDQLAMALDAEVRNV